MFAVSILLFAAISLQHVLAFAPASRIEMLKLRDAGSMRAPFMTIGESSTPPDSESSPEEKPYPDTKTVGFHRHDQHLTCRRITPPDFKLSLEFEWFAADENTWDDQYEFALVYVYLPDGRHYSLNVWTFEFFHRAINDEVQSGENLNGTYLIPPDLFVKEMTRDCLEQVISDLLTDGKGYLEDYLNPTIIDSYESYSKRRRLWKRFDHAIRWTWRRMQKKLGLIKDFEWNNDYYTLQKPENTTNNDLRQAAK